MVTISSLVVLDRRRGGRPSRAGMAGIPTVTRLAPAEIARAKAAARVCNQTLSDFVRDAIVTAASDCLEGDS
jgi:hypothetical protein